MAGTEPTAKYTKSVGIEGARNAKARNVARAAPEGCTQWHAPGKHPWAPAP
ncbi:hypothetical protein NEUTE1DRAFT_139765 [Neurospora tetrasperma FGSC 2508]|uniref:Uncharacterized protein n=1 Tax=Neurospora tetrasperma (strain FGSC 2508 / ATCC MYA-4615 / P0657) TaxID=510951 RepID=F8MU20_NEUT8|nr:uncharacterized protein NEUTE1DRAFT_139765 [Neurospora tetrasperma FGSC 2508]EGO55502.1 hypothetical protein NEUTE1DRAFT_139765 [Neurospora tetrasperma FGSC 2508]EGZ69264.1 hypothetical protein NEUTE2DRAFT_168884 [Neurospora tetrasperma FGSC 2509]